MTIEIFIQTFLSWALGHWIKNNVFLDTKLKESKAYFCFIAAANETSFGSAKLRRFLRLIRQKDAVKLNGEDRLSMIYQVRNSTI